MSVPAVSAAEAFAEYRSMELHKPDAAAGATDEVAAASTVEPGMAAPPAEPARARGIAVQIAVLHALARRRA